MPRVIKIICLIFLIAGCSKEKISTSPVIDMDDFKLRKDNDIAISIVSRYDSMRIDSIHDKHTAEFYFYGPRTSGLTRDEARNIIFMFISENGKG